MVFSSIPFVFFFLPLCLILYYGTSFLPCPGRRLDVQTPSERGKFPVQEQAARGRSRRSPAYGRSCFHGEGAIALKNAILLVFSLVFYAWGEPVYILLMLFASAVDYVNGLLMNRFGSTKGLRRCFLFCSVLINLSVLAFFKYADFAVRTGQSRCRTQDVPCYKCQAPLHLWFGT